MSYDIYQAVRKGDIATLEQCLDEGFDVNRKDQFGWTALHHAADCNQSQCMFLLLQHNAQPNLTTWDNGQTALFLAAQSGSLQCIQVLHEFYDWICEQRGGILLLCHIVTFIAFQ